MTEYHVGCGMSGIYAGTIKKPGEWKTKSPVTDEALRATAEYMMGRIENGHEAYEITWTNRTTGKKIVLTCKVIEPHPEQRYLSFEQTVDYLKTTERSLADRVRAREIPHIKDGKFTKFKREDLDAYMESRRIVPIDEIRRAV